MRKSSEKLKIILNHKMNLLYKELNEYIKRTNKIKKDIIIAPSNIYLLEFIKSSKHQISSQDVCYIDGGDNTGKVSWRQIKSLGIKYTIIGHSEKGDSIQSITQKIKKCLENDITPILCFGNENKNEMITNILDNIGIYDGRIIYAYEPLYNIASTDLDIEDIEKNIKIIKRYLKEKGIVDPQIVYGGGINENNIKEIYNIKEIIGIMIGSKSSDIDELEKILLNIDEK